MFDNTYLNIIASSAVIYIFIVLCIRLVGKNELTQLSLSDLVFILLISNSVQNAMVGSDSSLLGGLLAASTLFIINKIFRNLLYRSDKFTKFMDGEPTVLIRHGKLNHKQMKKNKINIRELKEAVREQGIADFSKVDLAILEVDGRISVIKDENLKKGSEFDIDEEELT